MLRSATTSCALDAWLTTLTERATVGAGGQWCGRTGRRSARGLRNQ
jgi:hypothetical protein